MSEFEKRIMIGLWIVIVMCGFLITLAVVDTFFVRIDSVFMIATITLLIGYSLFAFVMIFLKIKNRGGKFTDQSNRN